MKKTLIFAVAGLSMAALASCSGKKENKEVAETTPAPVENTVKTVAYTGVIPAADCEGIKYAMDLAYNEEGNGGTYQLTQTYFNTDSAATEGIAVLGEFNSEGTFKVTTNDDKSYITLYDDSTVAQDNFLIDSDSTITMVNAELEVPTALNYTLSVVK
ncbi:MAG: copper resistance protein NlpE [Bacteroidales bacterium]|nr:copper resistance protein NlpE [Bacteroidales bacterium]